MNRLPRLSKVILPLCVLLLVAGGVSLFFVNSHAERSQIAFSMFETALMILVIFLPALLNKTVHIRVPAYMEIMFVSFCFCSMILGDVIDFYGMFGWWDKLQHAFSGVMLGILAYSIINMFNRPETGGSNLRFPPLFVATWVVCFAMAIGGLWEIIEFVIDGILGTNMQQFLETRGTFDATAPLIGRSALKDTMTDLLLDLAGSALLAVIGFLDLRRQQKDNLSEQSSEIPA